MQILDLEKLFTSEKGKKIYDNSLKAIADFSMEKDIFTAENAGCLPLPLSIGQIQEMNWSWKECCRGITRGKAQ